MKKKVKFKNDVVRCPEKYNFASLFYNVTFGREKFYRSQLKLCVFFVINQSRLHGNCT